jgi:MFS family permease
MKLGRDFGWLWAAYAVSTVGTWLALDGFGLVAVIVLRSTPAQVSLLAAAGLAVGALIAVPLGPWVEFRRKRPVMIAMDLVRFLALLSLPAAYAVGGLTYEQLILVSVIVAAANIVFTAASGACLKALVRPEGLLVASSRFEGTMWTASVIGPPLGGVLIGFFGPLTTVVLDAATYVLSALGVRAISSREPQPVVTGKRFSMDEILQGWRFILGHPRLRPLFFNTSLVNGLIMATAPLLAVLLLRELGLPVWEYGLAFAVPCLGGLLGSRLARPLAARFGPQRVMFVSGVARACWLLGLAFVQPGLPGLALVMVIEFGLIVCCSIFNPVFATYRLEEAGTDRVARILSAWSITSSLSIAALTAGWGLIASVTSTRTALAVAGVLILFTPLLLPRREVRRETVSGGADAGLSAIRHDRRVQ